VHDFQVTQTGARTLRVALGDAASATRSRVRRVLGGWLLANGLGNVRLELDTRAPAPDRVSGKLRRIVRATCETHAP
jgi:hypothetical protein